MQAAAPAFPAVVEELADLGARGDQMVPGGRDVANDQECLGRTGSGRRDVLAEMDRATGARRRELDQAEIFAGGAVNVEPPSDPFVKLLRALDIRNGDDDDLELHVNSRDARVSCCVVTTDFIGAHGYLLCSVGDPHLENTFGDSQRPTCDKLIKKYCLPSYSVQQ